MKTTPLTTAPDAHGSLDIRAIHDLLDPIEFLIMKHWREFLNFFGLPKHLDIEDGATVSFTPRCVLVDWSDRGQPHRCLVIPWPSFLALYDKHS